MAAILEFLADSPAHFETMILGHRHIAGVEQAVQVATHENAVRSRVFAAFGIWLDMSGLKSGQRPLARYRASPIVEIGDQQPEGSLSEPRTNQGRLAISGRGFRQACRTLKSIGSCKHALPQHEAFVIVGGVPSERHDVWGP